MNINFGPKLTILRGHFRKGSVSYFLEACFALAVWARLVLGLFLECLLNLFLSGFTERRTAVSLCGCF